MIIEVIIIEKWQYKQRLALPLDIKIELSKQRIVEFYEKNEGNVYISFSGGKDSTVLLDIIRKIYPDTIAVFCDTGLEYPEIKKFVKTFNNVKIIKPKMNFKEVIEKYGYPVPSKEQAQFIDECRNTKSDDLRNKRLNGKISKNGKLNGKISEKWKFLIDAPFKISKKCCEKLKINPIKLYEKENNLKPFIGNLAIESKKRVQEYLKNGCNAYNNIRPVSMPLAFWTEQDILNYLLINNLNFCSVYGDIIWRENKLITTKCERTGCIYCMFGIHFDEEPNRIQRLKITHPDLYNYCIKKLKINEVLEYMNIPYE